MSSIDVLIATELALYGETLGSTVRAMRPELRVQVVEPEDLEALACRLRPLLVICTDVTSTIAGCSRGWIALYPEQRDEAVVGIAGHRRVVPAMSVVQILGVVDELRAAS